MNAWIRKFACAIAGLVWAFRTQNSFWVHSFFAVAAIIVGGWLRIDAWQWVAIVLAIVAVLVAESFNTAIEMLVQVIHPNRNPLIGRALDVAAGAVLLASLGSIVIGLITLGPPLLDEIVRWGLFTQ